MTPNTSTENEIAVANMRESTMSEEPQRVEDTGMYAKFSSVLLIPIVLCLATFCVAVDNTITSTTVARIIQNSHKIDNVGWYAAELSS